MTQDAAPGPTRVIKKLHPRDPGARRWAGEYGDRLVCVRYRVDPAHRRRQTTVEIVVDEAPTLASVPVALRVAYGETSVRQAVKAAGGQWDAAARVWRLALGEVRRLGLTQRMVGDGEE